MNIRKTPTTISEVLSGLAADSAARSDLITYQRGDGSREQVSGAELLERVQRAAATLRQAGVSPGDRVLLMLTTQGEFVDAFLGAVWADAIPVPLFPPVFAKQPEDFIANFGKIAATSGARTLVASDEIVAMINGFAERLGSDFRILPCSTWQNTSDRLGEQFVRKFDDGCVHGLVAQVGTGRAHFEIKNRLMAVRLV